MQGRVSNNRLSSKQRPWAQRRMGCCTHTAPKGWALRQAVGLLPWSAFASERDTVSSYNPSKSTQSHVWSNQGETGFTNQQGRSQHYLWVAPLCGQRLPACKLHFLWVGELRSLVPAEALRSRGKDPEVLCHPIGTSPEDRRPVGNVCCIFCLTDALIYQLRKQTPEQKQNCPRVAAAQDKWPLEPRGLQVKHCTLGLLECS